MGAWDRGLLDNETASDGLLHLALGVLADIERLGAAGPGAAATPRLVAAIGVLLQLSPYHFAPDESEPMIDAIRAHAGRIAGLPRATRRILAEVEAGEAGPRAERRARMARRLVTSLHVGVDESPFGRREAALFLGKPAAAYVQSVARRCVAMLDDDFADPDNWGDLCREGLGMGALAALLVLEPCSVSTRKLESWRRKARTGLAALEAADDDELEFHRPYYANLERVFAAVLRRFAAA